MWFVFKGNIISQRDNKNGSRVFKFREMVNDFDEKKKECFGRLKIISSQIPYMEILPIECEKIKVRN